MGNLLGFYVEKPILWEAQMSTCYNSCGVIILASLGSLGYMRFLPTFHKRYLRKSREKREERNKTLQKAPRIPSASLHKKAISWSFNRWIVQ